MTVSCKNMKTTKGTKMNAMSGNAVMSVSRVIALGALVACGVQANDRVPLEIEFPPPLTMGTPVPVNAPNLEPLDAEQKRPPVMIPASAKNVALNKTVTSSDEWPIIGELEYVTDGIKEGDEGNYVELGPGLQWVQIDLGKPHAIYAIAAWRFFSQDRAYHDVIVQVCSDPAFETGVVTLFNNDHDNSSGLGVGKDKAFIETNRGRIIPVDGAVAQYVRLYSSGNTANQMNHYIEVEVFGVEP
jgi:hypothetical protein